MERFTIHQKKKLLNLIIEYNSSMGGVDNLSRVLDPYSCQRKSLKWYRKIAELFLDVSIYNSFLVWRELNDSKDTHLNFRLKIITEIISWHSYTKGKNNRHGPQTHKQPLRLVERHFIRQMSQESKKQKRKCVRCQAIGIKKRETTYQCKECEVTLCVTPCFDINHTKKDIKSNLFDDSEDTGTHSTSESSQSESEVVSTSDTDE